jgi:hypothetical protein
MTPIDLRILCTALGFTAVVMQGGKLPKSEGVLRASGFANLIEEFCRTTLPDISDEAKPVTSSNTAKIDRLVERFKSNLKDNKNPDLPHDKDFLLQLYDRLQQRHRSRATDNLLADEILHLLNEELLLDEGVTQNADTSEDAIAEKLEAQQRMANAIIKIIKEKGECQPHDLRGKGFTADEIARHWPMAYALAEVEIKTKGS